MENLEVGDVVLCTVDRILGTTVFVMIEGNGEGSIITSEIAPGRIRNLRDYVVPKKRIVCKILRISGNRIDLSLRRVTLKEQKEVLERDKQEKSCRSILKTILGKDIEEKVSEICKKSNLYDFLQKSKEDSKELEKLVGKEKAEKILEILKKQKSKKTSVKKEIRLISKKPDGLRIIKEILNSVEGVEIKYISAGRYSLKAEDSNIKIADNKLKAVLLNLEKLAKNQSAEFSIK